MYIDSANAGRRLHRSNLFVGLAVGLVWILWLGGLAAARGAGEADLYTAEAPVAGESSEQRGAAIRAAFRDVLVKLTGRREVAGREDLGPVLDQVVELVQEYRYRLAPPPQGEAEPRRRLWVRFDAPAVDQLLARHQIPIWPRPRPRILLWLGVEQGGDRRLSNLEDRPDALAAISRAAESRGVVVQLPLLDLTDQARLSAADLWQTDDPVIREASQRYGASRMLSGRLTPRGGERWQAQWSLTGPTERESLPASGPGPLPEVLVAGVHQAVDRLVDRSAPLSADAEVDGYRLRFSGIRSLADYADLIALLGRQDSIARLALRRAEGDELAFDVWLRGELAALDSALQTDGRAYPAGGASPAPAQAGSPVEADRMYRWSP